MTTLDSLTGKLSRAERRYQRDQERGYSVDPKRVIMAYTAETVIVAASLYGAWLFAKMYAHDQTQFAMMLLAPLGYAVIEYCRVPLALSVRTQTSFFVRMFALIGVICAAGVTVKSMSQLGEIMFRPRLFDVVHAQEALKDAQNVHDSMARKIADSDAVVAQRKAELSQVEARNAADVAELGKVPKQNCGQISGVARNGHAYRGIRCVADPRIKTLTLNLQTSTAARQEAVAKMDAANADRAKLDTTEVDQQLSKAEMAYREAVLHSQLHSFTAMVFGKNPTEVTDAEIHQFLRFFVFFPAVFVSFASTLLAFTAVERVPPETITLADEGGQYALGPFAETVLQEAVRAARQEAENTVAAAKPAQEITPPQEA